jgi:hypothetical protein
LVGEANFKILLDFVNFVSKQFVVPDLGNNIALIVLDDKGASLVFDLTLFQNVEHLERLLAMIRFPPTSDRNPQSLHHGLVLAHEILFGASARPKSSKYLITVTAGNTAPNIREVSSGLRNEGVEMFVVDLSPTPNPGLLQLVSKPDANHVFEADMSDPIRLGQRLVTVASTIIPVIKGMRIELLYFQFSF